MQPNSTQPVNGSVSNATSKEGPLGANAMVNLAKIASSQAPGTQQQLVTINPVIRPKPAQQLRPLQGATISLPAGLNLPAGTVLMQNDKGQLVIVSRPVVSTQQIQPTVVNIRPNIQAVSPTVQPRPTNPPQKPAPVDIVKTVAPVPISEDVRKCKNFLDTLLRLSSQQPPQTFTNVKNLIQGLLEGSVPAEKFTNELQKELKSQKQPGLAPFLNKSLPELRNAVKSKQLSIDGLSNEWIAKLDAQRAADTSQAKTHLAKLPTTTIVSAPKSTANQIIAKQVTIAPGTKPILPAVVPQSVPVTSADIKKVNPAVFPVASQSAAPVEDPNFLNSIRLMQKLNYCVSKKGLRQLSSDTMKILSESCKVRLRDIITQSIVAAEHRLDIYKTDSRYIPSTDVRSQMKFLESLDKLEKKRKDDLEREALLRAAKSRTKTEDPEQAKLKQKAKEMQMAELEVARQRDANLTALAAIGPRKRKQDESASTSSTLSTGLSSSSLNSQAQYPIGSRPRLKKLNLRDIQYVLENDKHLHKSIILYKSHVR